MSNKIYYLSNPYRGNEEGSWIQAARAMTKLRERGLTVFSPIMHTHHYDVEGFSNPAEDWLAWDLALMDGMMKSDGCWQYVACCDHAPNNDKIGARCPICRSLLDIIPHYDSQLVMLLSKIAYVDDLTMPLIEYYNLWQSHQINDVQWKALWKSTGCCLEYQRAKAKFVRVMVLEDFENGVEMDL